MRHCQVGRTVDCEGFKAHVHQPVRGRQSELSLSPYVVWLQYLYDLCPYIAAKLL